MATNQDFDDLIDRITVATNTLESDVATINQGAANVSQAVAAAELAVSQAQASQAGAAASASTATTQAGNASNSALTATNEANRAKQIANDLLAVAPFNEAPIDGETYGRKDGEWAIVSGGGGGAGTVQSVNSITPDVNGNITLTAADVGAKPSSYVPTWTEVTGIPATFAPSDHTHAAADVTSGTFAVARIPNLSASKITSGTIAAARLGSGTPTASTVLLGDGTWGSAPAVNMDLDKQNDTSMYGSARTAWPFSSIFKAVKLDQVQNSNGSIVGAAFFSSNNIRNLPGGIYAFDSNDFASGSLQSKGGFILVVSGEIGALNNFQTRAIAWVDPSFTAGTIGEVYVWSNNGWVRVNGT